MNFRAHSIQFDNPATVTMRYAATKPTATTLHTHGRELCSIATTPPQVLDGKHTAVCSGNINDATGSIPTGGYLWAYTVDSETAVSRNWVIRNPKPAFDNGRAVITGVTNGTEYEVEVNATNPAGSSASWSNTSSTKAGGPDAPDAPTLAPGNAQLSVSWTAPANNGSAITDYDVRYKAKTVNTWTSHAFTGAGTSTTISSGIANGTEYEVQVRATNGNGTGEWSPSATLKAGVPAAPAAPTLAAGNAQLSVSWTAPANNGSAITDYDVQYKATTANTWTSHAFTGTSTSTTISSGVTNGTEYEVQVRATNGNGTGEWSPSATLKAGVPAAPAAPALASGNAQLDVSWTAPASNGGSAVTDYDVQYSSDGGTTWTEWNASNTSTTTSATITTLTNGTSYQVQVRAGNANGDGPWSPSATLKAGLPAAPAAPTLASGNAQLTATWVAPSANGGTLSGFKVQYKRSSDSAWTTHTFSSTGSTTSTNIGSLTNGTAYDVQVRATNEHGDGPWSPSATLKAGLPAAPAAPTLTVRHQSLAVSWTAPANNGSAITDYDVQYSSDSGSTWTEWNAGNTSTDTNTTITGLTNATSYQVQVRAANTHGDGPWSPSASGTPANTAPGKPAAPSASLNNTNVSVTWTAPTYTGGAAITDYDLRWSSDTGTTWTEETDTTVTSTSRTVSVADLAGGASYVFSVRAQNSVGNGPWSDASTSVTLPARAPDAPGQPTVTPGNGSLTVSWTAPADNGAAITDYNVEYRTWSQAKSGPWVHWKPSETSTSTTTTITGTDNGTQYRTRVKARNSVGDSDWSNLSDPKSSGAPAVPDAPILTPGLGKMAVTWTAPDDHGSPIINYDVRYRTIGASTWSKLDFVSGVQVSNNLSNETSGPADPIDTGDLAHADMTKLGLSFTRESVGSGANEKFGVYKLNDGIKQVKLNFVASGVNGNVVLRFAATKPSATNLTTHGWTDCTPSASGCTPNNPHGPIPKNGYVWAYTTQNSTLTFAAWLFQNIDVAALSRSLEATTLTTGTEYEVQVRASNAHGDSGWSPSAKTTVGGPSAVRYLCAHPKNGALLMDWSAPATTNGTITDYDLRYREVGTSTWTEWKASETSTTRSATITGLTNGKQYEVQARAENANGSGPWSASEIMRAGVPGAFTRPMITPRFWDLTATWNAPADTGGSAITDYDVQYLNSDELPGDSNGIPIIPKNANGNPDWDLLPWIDWQASTVSTARSAQITGLDAVTAYWVRARAVNSNGDGVWSEPAADRTFMPNRVKNCSPTSTTTLPLGWYCDINAGVDGVGSFDSSSITAGTGLTLRQGKQRRRPGYVHCRQPPGRRGHGDHNQGWRHGEHL